MTEHPSFHRRRQLLQAGVGWAALPLSGFPAIASSHRQLPPISEGPFYPSPSYRARSLDWDADLTIVRGMSPDGQPRPRALGEHLELSGVLIDPNGRLIDRAEVEIWQCDVHASYRHPRGAGQRIDDGFQGFGISQTDSQGRYRFRTIRPVAYPGRTPHIHVKLRHPAFGEVTSQLFVAGEPGNQRDGLYRSLSDEQRALVDMTLQRAAAGSGVVWRADLPLVAGR